MNNKGGIGIVIKFINKTYLISEGPIKNTTNNRMELFGCIRAYEILLTHNIYPKEYVIFSDSKYLVNGYNIWIKQWLKNNWLNSKKQPVINKDLWLTLNKITNLNINWVQGHSINMGNIQSDLLANKGSVYGNAQLIVTTLT